MASGSGIKRREELQRWLQQDSVSSLDGWITGEPLD